MRIDRYMCGTSSEQAVKFLREYIEMVVDKELLRRVDLPVLRGDASKLRSATGWAPSIPIEQTVADLLDDMRARVRDEPSIHMEDR